MGLTADFTRLGESVTTYAKALEKSYAAAVKQLQMMDNLEKKARTSALAIAESANKMSASAAKMEAIGGGGGAGYGDVYGNGNPFFGGKTYEQMLGWDLSPQINQRNSENQRILKTTLDSLENGTIDLGEAIDWLTGKLAINTKLIQDQARETEAERQLRDAKARFAAGLASHTGNIPFFSDDRNKINNLEKLVAEDKRAAQTAIKFDKQLKQVIELLNKRKAEDGRDAGNEFTQGVNHGDIKGQTQADDLRLEALAKKLMEAMMSGTNIKTYTIQLNGNDIRTIDDPTDLIRLIEEMSRSKRTAL